MNANPPKRKQKLGERNNKALLWPSVIIVLVVVCDQLTKYWAVHSLSRSSSVEVLGNFLMFSLVYNRGGAMGTSLGSPMYYLVVAVIILPFIGYYLYAHRAERGISYSLAFIAGGAIGNLIDRIRLGQVVDFIDVDFFDIDLFGYQLDRWWTFNVADAAIFCAIIFLIIYVARFHRPAKPVESPRRIDRGDAPTD